MGAVGASGSVAWEGDTVTVSGAGADIWNTDDEFRFVYTTLTGDGEIAARVTAVENVNAWTKAGVMMRETLTPGSKHAQMLVSPGKGYAFQRRPSTGGSSIHTAAGTGTAPAFVRLVRDGDTVTAYRSPDGATWTKIGSQSIKMTATIYVGLAVTSHVDGTPASATFTSVAVAARGSLPNGWHSTDVGNVGATGTATAKNGTISVTGSGADIWNRADAFRFAYTTLTGDGAIVTHLTTLQQVDAWTKAGVMIRGSLAADAAYAFMLASPDKGLAFQRRPAAGAVAERSDGDGGNAPVWVKLTRTGSTIRAERSADGKSWTLVGTDTVKLPKTVYVGLAVTSHVDGSLATATFTDTTIETAAGPGSDDSSSDTPNPVPPAPVPPPVPVPPRSGGSVGDAKHLRVMHWNTHHGGFGTDGKYDPDRVATWIAKFDPDLVSLNEVEKKTGWGNEDQPAKYKALLEAKTGHTWYMVWAQEYGNWNGNGKGNLIFSRFPWVSTSRWLMSWDRTVALGQIVVNGRNITFASTHLDPDSETRRLAQAKELLPWGVNFAENRIIVGDLNAQPTSSTLTYMKQSYTDAWLVAKSAGVAHAASDNRNGYTRKSRIDFVMTSEKAAHLKVIRVEVPDTRDARGHMPSDHRPIVVDYEVR